MNKDKIPWYNREIEEDVKVLFSNIINYTGKTVSKFHPIIIDKIKEPELDSIAIYTIILGGVLMGSHYYLFQKPNQDLNKQTEIKKIEDNHKNKILEDKLKNN